MTGPRLVALELEAFRGFAGLRRLDFDADIVLIQGDNGTGKTSVVDGLLWIFTGHLPRLADRAKGRRKGDDPIVNRYRSDGPARVRLTLATADGRRIECERTGRWGHSELVLREDEVVLDDAAITLGDVFGGATPDQLVQAVSSWGILQQHSLLAALDSGATLHQRLAEVVGLERVTRFANSATEVAKGLGREGKHIESVRSSLHQRRAVAVSRLAAAQAELEKPEDAQVRFGALVQRCVAGLPAGLSLDLQPTSLDELSAAGLEVGEIADGARELAAAVTDVRAAGAASGNAVEQLEKELESLAQRADEAVRQAPVRIRLAGAALELLGDDCPVCGQAIDAQSVRHHMAEQLQVAEAQASDAAAAQRAVAEVQTRLQVTRTAEERRKSQQQRVNTAAERLRGRISGASWMGVDARWLDQDSSGELARELGQFQDRLRDAHSEALRTTGEEIARLSAEVEASTVEVGRIESEVAEIGARVERAQALDVAARQAAERIVERALQRLAPSFAEVFDRLSPHPTFTELRAAQDIFYGKNQVVPEVYDPERKITANPALIFSEGQLNVVALSYFLGLALNAGSNALPFVVLDDPLQSMDVLSVLGFADLCRRLREHRQLFVTTHDRRFASLLGRKLAPREAGTRTILHEFDGWTADGPRVHTSDEPLAEVLPLLAKRAS